jgi:hypothetical protein
MPDPVTSEHKMHGCMRGADELEYYADLIAMKGAPLPTLRASLMAPRSQRVVRATRTRR